MAGVATFHGDKRADALPQRDRHPRRAAAADAGDDAASSTTSCLQQLRKRNGLGGAVLINAGRGRLQKDADIVRALEDGTLKEASLDVFEVEPLPKTSPLWDHPQVFVTPHAAATSDPAHLVAPMLAQMDAFERGEPLRIWSIARRGTRGRFVDQEGYGLLNPVGPP